MIQVREETVPRKIYSKKIALGTMSLELFLKTGTEALRLLTHRIAGKWNAICHRSYFSRSTEDYEWWWALFRGERSEFKASSSESYEFLIIKEVFFGLISIADCAGTMLKLDLRLRAFRREMHLPSRLRGLQFVRLDFSIPWLTIISFTQRTEFRIGSQIIFELHTLAVQQVRVLTVLQLSDSNFQALRDAGNPILIEFNKDMRYQIISFKNILSYHQGNLS